MRCNGSCCAHGTAPEGRRGHDRDENGIRGTTLLVDQDRLAGDLPLSALLRLWPDLRRHHAASPAPRLARAGHLHRQFYRWRCRQDADGNCDRPRREGEGAEARVSHHHRSTAVGDEPLLLAREALTVISRRRVAGAEKLVSEGVDLIIMDDGFQSARLLVDYALIVVDSLRGIGNGWVVPSGPVRAPIAVQMRLLDAILKVGKGDAADRFVRQASRSGKPVLVASVMPQAAHDLSGKPVLAFAGIADPRKFYRTLEELGAVIVDRQDFPDHHHLADDEIADLLARAERQGLQLVTTAKDSVRLSGGHGRAAELQEKSRVVDVDMVFDDPKAPDLIIDRAIEACRRRRLDKKA